MRNAARTGSRAVTSIARLLACTLLLTAAVILGAGAAFAQASGTAPTAAAPRAAGAAQQSAQERVRAAETTAINGHLLLDAYVVINGSGRPHDKYQRLHQERLWASAEVVRLRSELAGLLSHFPQKPVPIPVMSEDAYNAKMAAIDGKLTEYEAAQNNQALPESQRAGAHTQLLDLTRQKARAALELIDSRSYQVALASYDRDSARKVELEDTLTDLGNYLSKIDYAAEDLLLSSESDGRFRLIMGGGFVGLVSLLIGLFFFFGERSGLMKDFFKNDRGLQFITLFSLVIAITMFGLLNILEGRELTALLGGLSGYILGKSTFGADHKEDAKPGPPGSKATE